MSSIFLFKSTSIGSPPPISSGGVPFENRESPATVEDGGECVGVSVLEGGPIASTIFEDTDARRAPFLFPPL